LKRAAINGDSIRLELEMPLLSCRDDSSTRSVFRIEEVDNAFFAEEHDGFPCFPARCAAINV